MSERRCVEEGRATDSTVIGGGRGRLGGGSRSPQKLSRLSAQKDAAECLLILLSVLCGLLFAPACLGAGSGEATVTLQNQKIYCWGRSIDIGIGALAGETYPDHLNRLLVQEVDHCTISDNMRPGTSTETLEAASYFEEHKYGIIIMRMGYDSSGSGIAWDVTEDNLRRIIRRLKDTGAVVVMFESGPLWDLDGQLTTTDDQCMTGTSKALVHPYIVCDSINNETQTAKYYDWWGGDRVLQDRSGGGCLFPS